MKIKSKNKVKNSYTKEEVLKLCLSARLHGQRHGEILWEEWIKENL